METPQENSTEKTLAVPPELPLLPLKDTVVYPLTVYPLVIGKEKSIKLINDTGDLIGAAKTHTSQIMILTPTPGRAIASLAERISSSAAALAVEQGVAVIDLTRWSTYRGERYAWAYLANEFHPSLMGHIMMAELMLPAFTGEEFVWPASIANHQ